MAETRTPPSETREKSPFFAALGIVDRFIARIEAFVLAYGIILMAVNSIANVIGRVLLNQSLYFSEEVGQFLIVLVTFVGIGYGARRGRHIRMSALYDQFDEPVQKVMMIVVCAVTSILMFVLSYYSVIYVERLHMLGSVTPALQFPLYLTYIWVPIGFAVTGVQYALTVVKNLRHPEVYVSYEELDAYDELDSTSHA